MLAKALDAFHLMLAPDNSAAENAELFFHLSMDVGQRRPGLFPTEDACLLAANLLLARHGDTAGWKVVCLDWTLLPTAMLLAGYGVRIYLPPDAEHENVAKNLSTLLAEAIPGSAWSVTEATTTMRLLQDSLILGGNPVTHTVGSAGFPESLSDIRGGVFFAYWDFLDVALYGHVREQWLASALLRSVVQLPRPHRQAAAHYPALVELQSSGNAERLMRLVYIKEATRGPGGLSQEEALKFLLEQLPPDFPEALDLHPADLRVQGSVDLKPGWHLSRRAAPAPSGSVCLSDVGQVICCQLPWGKVDSQEAAALDAEAAKSGSSLGGTMVDGSFVC